MTGRIEPRFLEGCPNGKADTTADEADSHLPNRDWTYEPVLNLHVLRNFDGFDWHSSINSLQVRNPLIIAKNSMICLGGLL